MAQATARTGHDDRRRELTTGISHATASALTRSPAHASTAVCFAGKFVLEQAIPLIEAACRV